MWSSPRLPEGPPHGELNAPFLLRPALLAMNLVWHLGNDVVDLADPRCRWRSVDDRFLARVFHPLEAEAIRTSADPEREIWIRWAGKESAFKTVSKLLGSPPPFQHPSFRIEISPGRPDSPILEGIARYLDLVLPLRVEPGVAALHALSWTAPAGGAAPEVRLGMAPAPERTPEWRPTLRARFSAREWACVSHEASALTRLAARQAMASAIGVEEARLEIICRTGHPGRRIPLVLLDGKETAVDLSLSHHGRFLAWAFAPFR